MNMSLMEKVKRIRGAEAALGLRFCSKTEYITHLPDGSRIFAVTDSTLFCFVEGYQETVFAVDIVFGNIKPLTYDFSEFLRLIISCGSAEYAAGDLQDVPGKPVQQINIGLKKLQVILDMVPIQNPSEYLRTISQVIDCSRIKG